MATKTLNYTIIEEGYLYGVYRKKGETVDLTEDQARFFVPDRLAPTPVKGAVAKD